MESDASPDLAPSAPIDDAHDEAVCRVADYAHEKFGVEHFAFDGLTPRQAARADGVHVVELILLLREYESIDAALDPERPNDVGFLWTELGVRRPRDA